MPYGNIMSRTDVQALIPEEVSSAMLGNLSNESAALALFAQINVPSNQTRFPVISALPTAYFVSGDTGYKQTTEVNWANKYLNVEELAAIVPIPEAVLDDASFDVWGNVQPLVEQAIGRALDAAIFFGTNKPASWPGAIVTDAVSAGNTVTRGTSVATAGGLATDISALLALIEADGYDPNGAIGNRAMRGRLRDVRDSTGQRVPEVSQDNIWGSTLRFPMRGQWPTGSAAAELIMGDFTEGVIGVRQDFTWKLLDQAVITDNAGSILYNLAQQDMVAMRVVFRVAWTIANPLNYDQAVDAQRYPFGVLRAP